MKPSLPLLLASLIAILSGCVVDPDPPRPNERNRIYFQAFDTTRARISAATLDGASTVDIVFDARMFCAPRGGKIAYYRAGGGSVKIAVAKLDGSNESIIDTLYGRVEPVILSPDGSTVAYLVEDTSSAAVRHLWITDIATRRKRYHAVPYQFKQHLYQQITFSPDSRYVAVNAGPHIHIFGVRDSSRRLLNVAAMDGDTVTWIEWSPRGNRIAFESHRLVGGSGRISLHIINADGSGRVTLLDSSMAIGLFSWSPQGDELAVGRTIPDPNAPVWTMLRPLWTFKADGSGSRVLVTDGVVHNAPQWSPDGSSIAYARSIPLPQNGASRVIELIDLRTLKSNIVAWNALDPYW